MGRKAISDKPMSGAERVKRCKARKSARRMAAEAALPEVMECNGLLIGHLDAVLAPLPADELPEFR